MKFFSKIIKLIKKCFTKNKETTSDQLQTNPSDNSITRLEARTATARENWSHNANPTSTVEINFSINSQEDITTSQPDIVNSDINDVEDLNSLIEIRTNYVSTEAISDDGYSIDNAEPLNSSIETDYTSDDEQFQENFSYQNSNASNLEKKSIVPSLEIKKAIEIQKELIEKKEPATTMNPESNSSLSAENLELKNEGWT